MTVTIRNATSEADLKAAYALITALAAHEDSSHYLKITEAAFTEGALAQPPRFHVVVAEELGAILGVMTYTTRFHIWSGKDVLVLDDLYVAPTARGMGLGNKLLEAIGDIAKRRDLPVKWQVNTDNEGAIRLYKRIGADYSERGICFWRPENIA
ncbi:GNAT family N-acetyltransferase [Kordiimonas sp.]|uniref:GNAT family N-acetyltransferase n=1 Tax=Kordiimonas sp. TaxID=1970157 RepID=UPI003A8CFD1D